MVNNVISIFCVVLMLIHTAAHTRKHNERGRRGWAGLTDKTSESVCVHAEPIYIANT